MCKLLQKAEHLNTLYYEILIAEPGKGLKLVMYAIDDKKIKMFYR